MSVKYGHTNIVARDWRRLADFYVTVFACRIKPPERDLRGSWLDGLTGIAGAEIRGAHLLLPGYGEAGPTLEIFQYNVVAESQEKLINRPGFGHIAFVVDDVDAALAKVLANGGSALGDVVHGQVPGAGGIHVVYARDPEDNIIELQRWD